MTDVDVNEDKEHVFVDVSLSPTEHAEGLQYRTPGKGIYIVPEEGDIVQVQRVGRNRRVAFSPYNVPEEGFPSGMSPGDIVFQLNENTSLRMSQQDDGTYDVTIECDGDLQLDGESIFIGENGTRVAPDMHTHDFEDANGNIQTTEIENEPPTFTKIE